MCGDKELTKDTLQSFFLYIWENRHKLGKIEKLDSYLKTAFYRQMLSVLKAQKKQQQQLEKQNLPQQTFSYETLLIQLQEEQEQQAKLEAALAQLSEQQRNMLQLRFFKELSYDEITAQTGKSRQTIYNQIHAAIKILREKLSD